MNPTNWKKLTGFQIANQTLQIDFHQPYAQEAQDSPAAEGFVHEGPAVLLLFPSLFPQRKGQ